ncbi:MAG: hypothetical protein AAB250_10170 [Bdellovibrionota bacterium]
MTRLRIATSIALCMFMAACSKPSDSSPAGPPVVRSGSGDSGSGSGGGDGATGRQVGEGTAQCPFSTDPATYAIIVPESTKVLEAIPAGRYVLTQVRTMRSSLTTLQTAVFSNGAKIILKEPGRIGTTDTTQVLIQDRDTSVTAGNLSFPLSFESKAGEIKWGRFASYEPKIETGEKLRLATPVINDHDEKILTENTGRYTFNVFARKRLSGYQTVVKLSQADFGFIKGLISIGEGGDNGTVKFVISMPRGSASTDVTESTYELTFATEANAKAPDCGANASAIKILGSSS